MHSEKNYKRSPSGDELLRTLAEEIENTQEHPPAADKPHAVASLSEHDNSNILEELIMAVKRNTGKHTKVVGISPTDTTQANIGFAIIEKTKES